MYHITWVTLIHLRCSPGPIHSAHSAGHSIGHCRTKWTLYQCLTTSFWRGPLDKIKKFCITKHSNCKWYKSWGKAVHAIMTMYIIDAKKCVNICEMASACKILLVHYSCIPFRAEYSTGDSLISFCQAYWLCSITWNRYCTHIVLSEIVPAAKGTKSQCNFNFLIAN